MYINSAMLEVQSIPRRESNRPMFETIVKAIRGARRVSRLSFGEYIIPDERSVESSKELDRRNGSRIRFLTQIKSGGTVARYSRH